MALSEGQIDKESIKNALLEYLTESGNGGNLSNSTAVSTPQESPKIASTKSSGVKENANIDVRLEAIEKVFDIRIESIERRVTFLETMLAAMSSD